MLRSHNTRLHKRHRWPFQRSRCYDGHDTRPHARNLASIRSYKPRSVVHLRCIIRLWHWELDGDDASMLGPAIWCAALWTLFWHVVLYCESGNFGLHTRIR